MNRNIDYARYACNMRLNLSLPEMITDDGSIRHEYFLNKKGGYWGPSEDEKLKKALKEGLFGQWDKIKGKYKLEYVDYYYPSTLWRLSLGRSKCWA